ncbi:MAG: hypothetical protein RL021_1812 [Bacteroidota bacterium]
MSLWKLTWLDTEVLNKDFRGREIARQMIRSVGSISANIEEGYGRGFGRDFRLFLTYARGSARESKGWYLRAVPLLGNSVVKERTAILDTLIGMLTISINRIK